jgi:glyoxylase-like metal-dependent hydrolase (beta-lactamase superfamily II)
MASGDYASQGGEEKMGLTVKALHIGDAMMDWSFLLFRYKPGRKTCIPINSYLIRGAETPILVDTGVRDASVFVAHGNDEIGFVEPEQDILLQLKEEGLSPADIGCIIQTHLAIDHTGNTPRFPNARIVVQRQEMAYQATNNRNLQPDLPWFINNIKRVDFITGDIELFPGIKCVLAPGHTQGHQHVEVQTDAGKIILSGDTVYDIPMQLEDRGGPGRIWPSGNLDNRSALMDALQSLKRELKKGAVICPVHGYEPFDRYKLGQRRSDKRRDYEGFPSLKWPPEQL